LFKGALTGKTDAAVESFLEDTAKLNPAVAKQQNADFNKL
jgi:hypothetical protein